jgi:hypothetical protein
MASLNHSILGLRSSEAECCVLRSVMTFNQTYYWLAEHNASANVLFGKLSSSATRRSAHPEARSAQTLNCIILPLSRTGTALVYTWSMHQEPLYSSYVKLINSQDIDSL